MGDLGTWYEIAGIVLACFTLLAIVGAQYRKRVKPKVQHVEQVIAQFAQTVMGRPAEYDAYRRETSPAIPPLAEQVAGIRSTVEMLVERDARLTALETTVAEHGQRLTAIEAGHQFERALGHVTQGKVVDAIAEANRRRDRAETDVSDTDQEG